MSSPLKSAAFRGAWTDESGLDIQAERLPGEAAAPQGARKLEEFA